MPSYKSKFISNYDKLSPLIDGPYNRPSIPDEITEEDFEAEYECFRNGLLRELNQLGETSSSRKKGDFSVGHRIGFSRGVGVVVDNKRFFSPLIIEILKNYVDRFSVEYVVALSGEHEIGEDFYIAVTKHSIIQGTAESRKWLAPFGFK